VSSTRERVKKNGKPAERKSELSTSSCPGEGKEGGKKKRTHFIDGRARGGIQKERDGKKRSLSKTVQMCPRRVGSTGGVALFLLPIKKTGVQWAAAKRG